MTRLALALVVAGCNFTQRPEPAAAQIFSTDATCPTERVQVKPRPDVAPATVLPPPAMEPPPAEVAADPERMKLWRAQHDTAPDFARLQAQVFEVTGCGHRTLYVCAHPRIDNRSSSEWAASWDGQAAGVNTSSVARTNATAVEDGVLASAVVCLSGK